MKDPRRLLSDRPTDLERTLLFAAARERPSLEHRQQLRRALDLASRKEQFASRFWSRATKTTIRAALAAVAALVTAGTICAVTFTGHRMTAGHPGQTSALEGLASSVLALADTDEPPPDTSKIWNGSNESRRESSPDRAGGSATRNAGEPARGGLVDGGPRASQSRAPRREGSMRR